MNQADCPHCNECTHYEQLRTAMTHTCAALRAEVAHWKRELKALENIVAAYPKVQARVDETQQLRTLCRELVDALDDPFNHLDSGDTWDGDIDRCPASQRGDYATGERGPCDCSIGPLIARARELLGNNSDE